MEKHCFKVQLGNKGCYCEIFFKVSFFENVDNNLRVSYLADLQWEFSCRSGIAVFYDYFIKLKAGSVDVIIYDIKWRPVDTNNLIVFFCTIEALSHSLSFNIDKLRLDTENDFFQLPVW
jgi:hypothetical protein